MNPPAPAPGGTKSAGRIDAIDWLRGLAVVLMIETHLYGYWTSPAAQATALFRDTRWWGGFPFRMFLLLAGVSMAIKFEAQIARGIERSVMVRGGVRRGFEILVLAYLFRLQEFVLGFFWDWRDLFRVDILNCLGASMMLAAFDQRAAPRAAPVRGHAGWRGGAGRPGADHRTGTPPSGLAAAAPGRVHRGPRQDGGVPLIPPMAWTLVGIAIGHWLVRQSRDPRRLTRAFVICGVVGAAMVGAVKLVRVDRSLHRSTTRPRSRSRWALGTFFHRLGSIGMMALLAHGVTRLWPPPRFSVMRVFGQTSLLVYWVHVELVYGLLFKGLANRLSMAGRRWRSS